MEEEKVGRFLFTPFSIFRYERLGTQWMHKKLLDLPIQQERLGPRLTCKFFLEVAHIYNCCPRWVYRRLLYAQSCAACTLSRSWG